MGSAGSEASVTATPAPQNGLDERDKRILAFEQQHFVHAGAKDDAIRSELGLSAARYYQLLNALIDTPAAIVHDPQLVRRLQRVRDARIGTRTLAQLGRTGTTRPHDAN